MTRDSVARFRRWLDASETRKRLLIGALWGGVAGLAPKILTILASYVLARRLGSADFGAYGMVNNTTFMVGSVAGLGMGMTITKYTAELRSTDVERTGRIMALMGAIACLSAGLGALILLATSGWLAERVLAAPQLAHLLQFSAITMALYSLNAYQTSVLAGLESFRTSSLLQVAGSILQSVLVVALGWYWRLNGAVIGLGISMILTVGISQYWVSGEIRRHKIQLVYSGWLKEKSMLLRFSLPGMLASFLVGPVMWMCNTMLANRPNGYSELGVFNAALQWQGAVQLVPVLLGTAVLPVLSERMSLSGMDASYRIMMRMVWLTVIVSLPVAFGVSFLSKTIMSGYGVGFRGGHWVLVFVVFSVAFSVITTHLGNFIAAIGRMWLGFWLNLAWAILTVLGSYLFLGMGAEGLAGARCLAYAIHMCVSLFVCFCIARQHATGNSGEARQ